MCRPSRHALRGSVWAKPPGGGDGVGSVVAADADCSARSAPAPTGGRASDHQLDRPWQPFARLHALSGEQVLSVAVECGVAQLGERSCFELAYPFPRQLEMDTNLVQGPGLTAVEPEAQLKDRPFALV